MIENVNFIYQLVILPVDNPYSLTVPLLHLLDDGGVFDLLFWTILLI
jgi:hypothetical protein